MNKMIVFTKLIRCGLWILLPLLFTSYISPGTLAPAADPVAGNYSLQLLGSNNVELTGKISFDSSLKYPASGREYAVTELQLENDQGSGAHSLGFLISRPGTSEGLAAGTYRISRNGSGYFPNFDGAFGFANIDSMGELPFFAKDGSIKINRNDPDRLEGSIEIKFSNENNQQLTVQGKFSAIKK